MNTHLVLGLADDTDVSAVAAALGIEPMQLVKAQDDQEERAAALGGTAAWAADIATGVVYGTFRPRYRAVISVQPHLDELHASIVRECLTAHKTVLYVDPVENGCVAVVTSVRPSPDSTLGPFRLIHTVDA